MDASSFNHGLCRPTQTLWAQRRKRLPDSPGPLLKPCEFPFLLNEPDANRAQSLVLTRRHPRVFLSSCCTDRSWISCGCCRCPCWRCALPSPWMRRQVATVCSPVSPSPCACARGCPTTPPSCPTYWTITTSRLLPWLWRYSTPPTCQRCSCCLCYWKMRLLRRVQIFADNQFWYVSTENEKSVFSLLLERNHSKPIQAIIGPVDQSETET